MGCCGRHCCCCRPPYYWPTVRPLWPWQVQPVSVVPAMPVPVMPAPVMPIGAGIAAVREALVKS